MKLARAPLSPPHSTDLDDHVPLPVAAVRLPVLRYHDDLSPFLDALDTAFALGEDSVILCLSDANELETGIKRKEVLQLC